MNKTPVIFDHDGGVDDLLSLMLLLTMEHIELLGVTITPADCYLSDATTSTLKLLTLFGRTDIPVARGRLHGVNAFPADWRAQPKMCNALPEMLAIKECRENLLSSSAEELIGSLLAQHQEVSLLLTGPCSNLTAALKTNSELRRHIKQVIWMGGAVNVAGNVAMHNHNTTAEWNAFWDPLATRQLLESRLNIKLIALDATNALPVNIEFLKRLASQRHHLLANLAGQFWALTVNSIPAYEFTYYMWDVLATCYLGLGEECLGFETLELAVSVDEPNAGQTYIEAGSGNWIDVATTADRERVLDYVVTQFSRPV